MTPNTTVQQGLKGLAWWLIALSGTAALLLLILTDPFYPAARPPGAILQAFSTFFLGIFIEAAPFLLLGALASGLIEAFIHRDDLTRWIPRNPLLATLGGTLMGFAFPVCECGVVPVTRRLFNKGLPMSVGVAFLLAAPVMNPVVLASTATAFPHNPEMVIGRILITALVASAVGLIFAYTARPQDVLLPTRLAPVTGGSDLPPDFAVARLPNAQPAAQRRALLPGLVLAVRTAGYEFFDIGRYLIVGSLMAAALRTFVPQEALIGIGQSPVTSVLTMQVLAFILSVCSTVDAFLALAFVGTFSTGALLAFLSFGPMVDIKSTLMFMSVFKRRTVLYLVLVPFLMNLLIGIWINLNLAL